MDIPKCVTLAVASVAVGVAHAQTPTDLGAVGAPVHLFSIAPAASAVQLLGHLQFSVTADEPVSWEVNGIPGGSAAVGTITRGGLYTAPASLPESAHVVIAARPMSQPQRSESALISLASGAVYYVSTSGSDSNASTKTAP